MRTILILILAIAACASPPAPVEGSTQQRAQACCDLFTDPDCADGPCDGGGGGVGACNWASCDPLGPYGQPVCTTACGHPAGCICDYVYQDGYCPSAHCG